jgi:hypothetical protein
MSSPSSCHSRPLHVHGHDQLTYRVAMCAATSAIPSRSYSPYCPESLYLALFLLPQRGPKRAKPSYSHRLSPPFQARHSADCTRR